MGRVSTIREREQDMTALMAKSVTYRAKTASTMVNKRPGPSSDAAAAVSAGGEGGGTWTNMPTISLVNPRVNRPIAMITEHTAIKGRRLPHCDLEPSDITPTTGWTMRPDKGPASQTSEVCPLVRPRDSRYGVQSR